MKRIVLFLLGALLLTAQAEEINSPLVHANEMESEFVAVDISPVIRFKTDETGVFAVVIVEPLAASEEITTPEQLPAFLINYSFTSHSITYTLTPIGETTP